MVRLDELRRGVSCASKLSDLVSPFFSSSGLSSQAPSTSPKHLLHPRDARVGTARTSASLLMSLLLSCPVALSPHVVLNASRAALTAASTSALEAPETVVPRGSRGVPTEGSIVVLFAEV